MNARPLMSVEAMALEPKPGIRRMKLELSITRAPTTTATSDRLRRSTKHRVFLLDVETVLDMVISPMRDEVNIRSVTNALPKFGHGVC